MDELAQVIVWAAVCCYAIYTAGKFGESLILPRADTVKTQKRRKQLSQFNQLTPEQKRDLLLRRAHDIRAEADRTKSNVGDLLKPIVVPPSSAVNRGFSTSAPSVVSVPETK